MIKRYVVAELGEDGGILALWGPFDTDEQATAWEGMPTGGHDASYYSVHAVYEAPKWETVSTQKDEQIDPLDYTPDIDR
jgi:hypothetical protein